MALFGWFLDRLCAGFSIALLAVIASQVVPFGTQYLALTAADLQRTQARVADITSGVRYQTIADPVRAELLSTAQQHAEHARSAHEALADRLPIVYPLALWQWADAEVRGQTWHRFVPHVPTTRWSVALTIIGALLGLLIYEAIKWPIVALLRSPRRRFKKRGGLI